MPVSQKIEFFFDIASPYSFLAALQIPRLEKLAAVEWRPFLIGGVFKASGNLMPAANPVKGQYMFQDLRRLFAYYGEPFRFPSRFPMNSLQAMRCITALPADQRPAATLTLIVPAALVAGVSSTRYFMSLTLINARFHSPTPLKGLGSAAGIKSYKEPSILLPVTPSIASGCSLSSSI